MDIRADTTGIDKTRKDWERAPIQVRRKVWAILRSVSFAAERRIKDAMPVDTGRARASWGHWSPDSMSIDNPNAGPGDAHYEENEQQLYIEQGSNVEYIPALNAGSSLQAPAGFIEAAQVRAQRVLKEEVANVLARWRGGL